MELGVAQSNATNAMLLLCIFPLRNLFAMRLHVLICMHLPRGAHSTFISSWGTAMLKNRPDWYANCQAPFPYMNMKKLVRVGVIALVVLTAFENSNATTYTFDVDPSSGT